MPAMVLGAPALIEQHVLADAGNSSTTTIVVGAPFVGTWKSTLGVNAIQFTLVCSQNATVYVDQGSNGTDADLIDRFEYNVLAGGNLGTTVQAQSAWYRIRVVNNGSINATTVRLAAFLCPMAEPLPRALTAKGYLPTAVFGARDERGNAWINNASGDANVNQPYRLVGTVFGAAIDSTFWTATASGTGATASMTTPGVVSLVSSSSGAGYGQLTSARKARYINTMNHHVWSRVRLTALSVAGTTRKFGAYTIGTPPAVQDGFVFSYDAANVLTLSCYNAGTPSSVASGSFNGDVSVYTVDTNVHRYEILYSIGTAQFMVDGVVLHTFRATTAPLIGTMIYPYSAACSGTGTAGTLEIWSGSIRRLGRDVSATITKYLHGATTGTAWKTSAGRLHTLAFSPGDTSATVAIYDSPSTTANQLYAAYLLEKTNPFAIELQADFQNGLWIVTTGASLDMTGVLE
jgi:hypothetical protein